MSRRYDVIGVDRVHVMHKKPAVDLKALYTKVAAVIADYDPLTDLFPLSRRVEPLVEVAIEAERACSDLPTQ